MISSAPGAIAARNPASVSAGSQGQRASSEQCRFCTVNPRPAFLSPADTTLYCASSSGNTSCRTFARDVLSGPSRSSNGSQSRNRRTILNISSAASCVWATSSVNVPGRVIVFRKNRAAAHVVKPIWRAFNTIFRCPRRLSKLRCATLARSGAVQPSRVLTKSSLSAKAIPTVLPPRLAGRLSRILPNRSSSSRSISARRSSFNPDSKRSTISLSFRLFNICLHSSPIYRASYTPLHWNNHGPFPD